ncbi:hypothetical protein [Flavobacterium sp. TSSA_36]|uniref:hypothetical protein n=1 Tax=Flavobacterium sp. TSSA_36 TaxID=3447669 RepID=UPI003F3693ED
MKIKSITGVTKVDEISVTKSIGALILAIDGLSIDQLTTEKISIYIERANGSNVYLANKIPVLDFILASSYGLEAVQSDAVYETIAMCELAVGGGIFLAEKESIKISLDGLDASKTYDLYGFEEPTQTDVLAFFEQKTVASEEFSKKIDVNGFDLAIMTTHATIQDVIYRFENGKSVKYLPFELQTQSRDSDPIQAIKGTAVLAQIPNRLALPLLHIDEIEVNKEQGAVINFVVRNFKSVQ